MKSLKGKILLATGTIMIVIVTVLTIISIQNAKTTYGNQFTLNISDKIHFGYNDQDKDVNIDIDGENDVEDALSFLKDLVGIGKDHHEDTGLSKANIAFAKESILIMVLIVIVGIIFLYIMIDRALRPVHQLSNKINAVNDTNLNKEVVVKSSDKEISLLANSFNSMRERLNDSFEFQRNFSANAAHELKTPLATMKAGIQVLQMEKEPTIEEYKETVDMLQQSTQRLIYIVDDLLDLSKEDPNGCLEKIVIADVIDIIIDELTIMAKDKNVTIHTGMIDGSVVGNQVLIYRALFNLIENAIKYNKEGGSVMITSKCCENGKVRIVIADDGIGIAEEAQKHVFEPFYRVDKSRSRQMGGSGLGLSIVKKIIDKHKGTITINSKEGSGTTIVVTI